MPRVFLSELFRFTSPRRIQDMVHVIDAGESLINFVDSIWLISGTAELSEITSTEEAADWAHRVLGAKNSLIAADAERIDEAFRGKLATFATATANGLETPPEKERPRTKRPSHRGKKQHRSTVIDKSVLALPELRRIRDREHVRYVTHQSCLKSCLICGRRPSDAHHL